MAWAHGIPITWLAKHSLFRGPLGALLRALGGVPVVRHQREDRVAATARVFADRAAADAPLVLVVPPEGTRARVEFWKSGFFHIARTAGVPVVPSALDYGARLGEIGEPVDPALGVGPFMDRMRAFYAGRDGWRPADFGPVRLREEASAEIDDAA